jgi:hypothetical protein
MTKIHNADTEIPFWDECNKNLFPWYKKGKWKRIMRKRWIKKQIKGIE